MMTSYLLFVPEPLIRPHFWSKMSHRWVMNESYCTFLVRILWRKSSTEVDKRIFDDVITKYKSHWWRHHNYESFLIYDASRSLLRERKPERCGGWASFVDKWAKYMMSHTVWVILISHIYYESYLLIASAKNARFITEASKCSIFSLSAQFTARRRSTAL